MFKFNAASGSVVLFAGRMIEEKGPSLAAQAIKDNIELIDRVIMVGSGPELLNVQNILEDIDVEYHGMLSREELAKQMTNADVFLFPSTREGESLGLVLVEAVSSGCIPLAVSNGAVNEILGDFSEGRLITTKDDFSDSLGELLANVKCFPNYSEMLQESIVHRFSAGSVAQKLVESLVK
jgi:glycosyltransferase involved in cell wall biosynthesis